MNRCSAITAANTACKGTPIPGEEYCYVHSPSTLEERRNAGSKGGKRGGKGRRSPISAELTRLQARFEELAERVEAGELDRGAAAVVCQLLNGARACVAGMLKAKELEELEERIAELEEASNTTGYRSYR
jgi:hypothetical protein